MCCTTTKWCVNPTCYRSTYTYPHLRRYRKNNGFPMLFVAQKSSMHMHTTNKHTHTQTCECSLSICTMAHTMRRECATNSYTTTYYYAPRSLHMSVFLFHQAANPILFVCVLGNLSPCLCCHRHGHRHG